MTRKRVKIGYGKDVLIAVLLAFIVVAVFIGVYFVRKPKEAQPSEASVGGSYLYRCDPGWYKSFAWVPTRTFELNFDDTKTGILTNQYLASGLRFDYNLTQGIGLNKVSVNNTLNPGNGYATTISSDSQPFTNPIASSTESSMVLLFPNPIQAIQFQMQYGEPFDLSDVNRSNPNWGVEMRIYVGGSSTPIETYKWDLTITDLTNIKTALQSVCFFSTGTTKSKQISRIDILVPADQHDRTGAYPPDKISFDNFKIGVPKGWTAPTR